MANSQLDPGRLKGKALDRWYRRSPQTIEAAKQAASDQKYDAFVASIREAGPEQTHTVSPLEFAKDPLQEVKRRAIAAWYTHSVNYFDEGDEASEAEFKGIIEQVKRSRSISDIYGLLGPDTFESY